MIAFPMSAHFAAVTYEQHRSYHIKKGFDSVFSAFTSDPRTIPCNQNANIVLQYFVAI